jgi:hypothetical protein
VLDSRFQSFAGFEFNNISGLDFNRGAGLGITALTSLLTRFLKGSKTHQGDFPVLFLQGFGNVAHERIKNVAPKESRTLPAATFEIFASFAILLISSALVI